ncbi:hypothetical protein AMELA_G00174130 [Ameiurus melas]|uniref:Uncharacterized protein n=1 Tax=Ameiurus melas TaxID=219545 RepID=A0A7J6ACU5_AMEME|nr:hypothetical protein AMELA_G00174130 [Ameiurus melas]
MLVEERVVSAYLSLPHSPSPVEFCGRVATLFSAARSPAPFCSRKTSTAGRNGDINVTQHGLLNKRV